MVDPHLDYRWAREAATSPGLVSAVTTVLGPDVAIEGSRLVAKPYGEHFPIAAHRDGLNESLHVDPDRSVAAWLAFTDMRMGRGSLEIRPASHRTGYAAEPERPAPDTDTGGPFLPMTLWGGEAVLFDMALEHRSASNEYGFYPRVAMSLRFVAPGAIVRRRANAPAPLPVAGDPHVWPVREIPNSRRSAPGSAPTASGPQATP